MLHVLVSRQRALSMRRGSHASSHTNEWTNVKPCQSGRMPFHRMFPGFCGPPGFPRHGRVGDVSTACVQGKGSSVAARALVMMCDLAAGAAVADPAAQPQHDGRATVKVTAPSPRQSVDLSAHPEASGRADAQGSLGELVAGMSEVHCQWFRAHSTRSTHSTVAHTAHTASSNPSVPGFSSGRGSPHATNRILTSFVIRPNYW